MKKALLFFDFSGVFLAPRTVTHPTTQLVQGMENLVIELRQNHRLFILSLLSVTDLRHYLSLWNLDSYFTEVLCSYDKAKDMQHLMEQYGATAEQCVFVTDTVRDIEAAIKAGVDSVGVTWGFGDMHSFDSAGVTYVANSPTDIISFLS